MTRPLNTLLLGGCLTRWPLVKTPAAAGKLALEEYGAVSEIHTFGEMFQMIALLRAETAMPQELRYLAHLSPDLAPVAGAADFADVDVVLLEPASPVELTFRGFAVNRFAINRTVKRHLAEDDRAANKMLQKWMKSGLVGLDEAVRADAAGKLAPLVRGADGELARAVIRETRAHPSDLQDGFRRMRQMFRCPIGVALYVFRYMPDGRAISWPAGFRDRVLDAAQGLPTFDPVDLVTRHGVEAAMQPGLSHYRKEFLPAMGNALVEFVRSVHRNATAA